MSKVIVIGTMHSKKGECSSRNLIDIIYEISPGTIFIEASNEKYSLMLKAVDHFNTPEIQALREIEKLNSIEVQPVDLDYDPFDKRLEAMQELFSQRIPEYRYASLIQFNEAVRLGFKFLNSIDNDQINRDKATMEQRFVNRVQDEFLSETYSNWLKWNNERENLWISKVNNYLFENAINKSVLLVGSAHRIRLMDKIEKLKSADIKLPHWDFNYFNEQKD